MNASADTAAAIAAKDEALAALRRGDLAAALAAGARAVAADETYAEGWAARGTVKLMGGDAAGAEPDLARAASLKPLLAEAHLNRAMALVSLNRLDDAEQALVRARTADPTLPVEVCFNRILDARRKAFDATGSREAGVRVVMLLSAAGLFAQADAVLARCLSNAPTDGGLWSLKGDLARRQGRFTEADTAARTAAELSPHDADAAVNVAGVRYEAGDIDGAVAGARDAAARFPDCCRAWIQLADILADDSGEGWEALSAAARTPDATAAAISRAMAAAGDLALWDAVAELKERLESLLTSDSANPLRLCFHEFSPSVLRRNAEMFSAVAWPARRAIARPAVAKSKLRIGYLSPDFRTHPIGTIMIDLLRHHDRGRFEIYGYAVGPESDDPERREIVAAVDRFAVLSDMPDLQAAQRIRDDGVDILIELAGHTLHSRLGILSFRPAPLQIHYLGYPGTVGASFIDYMVGDPWTIPQAGEPHFSERIIRLPHTYLVNSRRPPVAAHLDRAQYGFAGTDVVLCAFHHPTKITKRVFDAWMTILGAVPQAVLWLLADRPATIANLRREAEARGIDAGRLRFAPRCDLAVHLARYAVCDLMLDTTPYNGHATNADALWMGCPVLTAPGDTFASRVCAGLLEMLGLNDLIARDLDAYCAKAIALARDRDALSDLRGRLAGVRDSVLFDNVAFARRFEAGLLAAWDRALRGLPPATFDVPA